MNKVLLIGRLTKDAELKQVGENGSVVLNFTLAVRGTYVNEKGEREVDFIPVSYWRKSAENIAPYLTKGSLVSIVGKINIKSYISKEETKKYRTQIIAEQIQFLDLVKRENAM